MSLEALRAWSQALLWVTITLPVLAACAAGVRYYVDRRIQEQTSEQEQHEKAVMRADLQGAQTRVHELEERARPRELTATQRTAISDSLRNHPPRQVEMTVLVSDSEAENYAVQLEEAFKTGGWQVNMHRGMFMPAFHGIMVSVPGERIPVEHPAAVLVTALRAAGIEPLLSLDEVPDGQVHLKVSSK